jgi:hypothetical protein
VPTLRDLLYLDRQRVRQLLAQVDGGVLEKIVERATEGTRRRSGATLLKTVDLQRELTRDAFEETTVSLEDALLDLLMSSLDELEWITYVDGLDDPERWTSGEVHAQLTPGALLRLVGPTQILDPAFIKSVVDRSMTAMETMALFAEGGLAAANRSKSDRTRLARVAATKLMGGLSPDAARQVGDVFVAFFGEGMVVRHLPCGEDDRSNAFVGPLSDEPSYLSDTRSALFSKYGSAPSDWTLVAQVATVPDEMSPAGDEVDEDDEGALDRAHFEALAVNILRGLEDAGLTGAPAFPTITVTPIALYRGGLDE